MTTVFLKGKNTKTLKYLSGGSTPKEIILNAIFKIEDYISVATKVGNFRPHFNSFIHTSNSFSLVKPVHTPPRAG